MDEPDILKNEPRRYRIGDFARELGVTPDLLKYCERKGAVIPHTLQNGYRYYDFRQSAQVIEYLKLRNQGFAASEINERLSEPSFDSALRHMTGRREAIRKRIAFEQALLSYYDELEQMQDFFASAPVWQVRRMPAFYFLPHSIGHRFIGEERVHRCVAEWNEWLPVVSSCCRYPLTQERERSGCTWGMMAEAELARRVGLTIEEPVYPVPAQRCLEVYTVTPLNDMRWQTQEWIDALIREKGFVHRGEAYARVIAKIGKGDKRCEYAVVSIPLED